jgi:hypothetical protein
LGNQVGGKNCHGGRVAATGSSIRNHIEAGVYNDLTRSDLSAVFTQEGDDQQNKVREFATSISQRRRYFAIRECS